MVIEDNPQTSCSGCPLINDDEARILHLLEEETQAFFMLHRRYPKGRESEDVIDNAYMRMAHDGINVPYGDVYQFFISHQRRIIQKLEAE